MTTSLNSLLNAPGAPWTVFFDPSSRLYWLYCLTSAGIFALLWVAKRDTASIVPANEGSKKSRLWNRSTQLDLKLLVTNSVIRVTAIAPLILPVTTVATGTAALLDLSLGTPELHSVSRPVVAGLYTTALFLVSDASRYLVHRLFHRVPMLWRFHQIHHSATSLTPLTLHRIHPVEIFVLEVRRVLAVGITTGVFLYLFRGNLNGVDVLGVNAFGFLFNLTGANLRHSSAWLSYGRWLEHLLISPAQHQLHHSTAPAHHNRNFGSALALWDWLFNTLLVAPRASALSFGLSPDQLSHTTLTDALLAKTAPPRG